MAFRTIDKDGSNTIEYDEFKTLLDLVNCKVSEENIKKAFNALDADGSGSISFAEFLAFVAENIGK